VPNGYFSKFSRWHELSIMRHSRDCRELQQLERSSLDPEKIRAFLAFLDADAGYAMNRAVSAAKLQLSHADEAAFSFHVAGVNIERTIKRAEFETWIAPELADISACVDRAMVEANLQEGEIDRVFLTGGSSFVPAVRNLFEQRFGPGTVEAGDQLVSIAYGLALIAQEEDISRWAA